MLTLIEALNYRCLRDIRCALRPFQALVGPNGSGKSTFLDVAAFIGSLTLNDLGGALEERTDSDVFEELVWLGKSLRFELAVEAEIPQEHQTLETRFRGSTHIRYELSIGRNSEIDHPIILSENLLLRTPPPDVAHEERTLFPGLSEVRDSLLAPRGKKGFRAVFRRERDRKVNYYPETRKSSGMGFGIGWKFASDVSALGNLPEDEVNFPSALWLRNLLESGRHVISLESEALRHMSPPSVAPPADFEFMPDGSQAPRMLEKLITGYPDRYERWLGHVREALPAIESVSVAEREDIKHTYLVIKYKSGASIPSWSASEGTLRFLVLSLLPYLPQVAGLYLVEEPEIGIHPAILSHLADSLRSVFKSQVLASTHSPVFLSQLELADVLCFAQTPEGATDIVRGDEHPRLKDWHQSISLGDLLAAGVFGE